MKGSTEASVEVLPPTWPRVLIAEDDDIFREAVAEMLSCQGFEVIGQVGDAGEALALCGRLLPDVALIDYRMPGMNGVELTELIRQLVPDVQVVMLTAYDDQILSMDAMRSGVYCFLVKGGSPSLIVDAIVRAWNHKNRQEAEGGPVPSA